MNKIIFFLLYFCFKISSQNLISAEYFIDSDPGIGNGVSITGLSGDINSFSINIPSASLSPGFHTLAVRAKNDTEIWGLYEKGLVYISNSATNMANITDAEYFFDTDPGVGNAVAIAVTDGQNPSFVLTIPSTALANGFHTLTIRTKDANNNWGLYEKGLVYVSSEGANLANITDAEYFIDTDPGVGNANGIAVSDGQNPVFIVNIPTTALANGFHTLAIRAKDANNNWGLFEKGLIYISEAASNSANITDAEYFIDTDPGVGNAEAIAITEGQNPSFLLNFPTGALSIGFHTITIRTKDANNNWGLFDKGLVYISTSASAAGDMTTGEYFIDTDPGPGNGFPINIPVGQSFAQDFVLNVPRTLMNGEHILAIRMFDDWGLTDTKTFVVDGVALPLQLIDFSVKKVGKQSELSWQTANEVNTSHFEIERSSGQINFTKIGEVNAINTKENFQYHFEDNQLELESGGLFYYRLKMVDLDGKYSYSPIRSLFFEKEVVGFIAYPSPANKILTVDLQQVFPRIKAEIISTNGKELISKRLLNTNKFELELGDLPKGIYFLRLNTGEIINEIKFVKE